MTNHMRYLSLRPSLPVVQRQKDASVVESKMLRSRARLLKATTTSPTAHGAAAGVLGLSEFIRWYDANFTRSGLLDGLGAQEEASFRALARAAYNGRLSDHWRWTVAVRALRDRHKAAGDAQEAAYWRSRQSYERSAMLDGW
jgi:hypothetical protein